MFAVCFAFENDNHQGSVFGCATVPTTTSPSGIGGVNVITHVTGSIV
jgi:hypothetical protein